MKYIFPFIRIRYFILLAINTHIDCANNTKCSVKYIFKATKQGALKVSLHHFLLMTPEQLKQNPSIVHPNQKHDTDEGQFKIPKMKRNSSHLQNYQKNILHLTYLLKLQKSQSLQKHLKFLLYSTKQHIKKIADDTE